jgi:trans-aconitate methyltransferase
MKHIWQAEDYHEHSSVQFNAAIHLLQQIRFKGCESVLDVGCGDGKITAMIANALPNGMIKGIDISPEMIRFARLKCSREANPTLEFIVQDAQKLDYHEQFDLIFSCFALQWLPNPELFFQGAFKSLKFSGLLVAAIPLGISQELEMAIKLTTSHPTWKHYYESFVPNWHFKSGKDYEKFVIESGFCLSYFCPVSQVVLFETRVDFENYIVPWFTYLNPLPEHLKMIFLKQLIDKYLDLVPAGEQGKISFKFSRIDLIAEKSNPSFESRRTVK